MPRSAKKHIGRVTVRNIAEQAGVSIGSVSTVLNNRHVERRISLETVQKIREAAAALGYLPNISARRLRSRNGAKNSVMLALVTSFEAPIPLVKHFITALRETATHNSELEEEFSFSVMIEMFEAGKLCAMPGLLTGDHFNAAIILNTTPEDDQFLNRSHLPYPVVLVNRAIPSYPSLMEAPDSGPRAAEILVKARRSRLAVLHGSPLTQVTQLRVNSFMHRASELLGRPPLELVADRLSEEGGYDAVKAALKRTPRLDGLYAVSDALALGAYHALGEAGLEIPKDVAVVGVGDYEISAFFDPPLSCVGVSHEQLAREAGHLLLTQLSQRAGPGRQQLTIPVVEVLRASTGH